VRLRDDPLFSVEIGYLENIGSPTVPLFQERTGTFNPAAGIFGSSLTPFPIDINNNRSVDLFVTSFTPTGDAATHTLVDIDDDEELERTGLPPSAHGPSMDIVTGEGRGVWTGSPLSSARERG